MFIMNNILTVTSFTIYGGLIYNILNKIIYKYKNNTRYYIKNYYPFKKKKRIFNYGYLIGFCIGIYINI